jgi:hypothetical protein
VRRLRGGLGAAGQEEPSCPSSGVDAAADEVPQGWVALPFIDEHRAVGGIDHGGIGHQDLALTGVVQFEDGIGPPGCRSRFAHTPGSLESEGREISHKGVEFLVGDAASVLHLSNCSTLRPFYTTVCRPSALPFAVTLHSRLPGRRATFDGREHRIAYLSALADLGLLSHPVRTITVACTKQVRVHAISRRPLRVVVEKAETIHLEAGR